MPDAVDVDRLVGLAEQDAVVAGAEPPQAGQFPFQGLHIALAGFGVAGQNNGRISSTIDHISGEQANYTYDALQRLVSAQTVGPQWGQTFTYDGFGNLTSKTVTQGSGSSWAQAYDPATNRAVANPGITYDANGNTHYTYYGPIGYDAENRITSEGNCPNCTSLYYDPSGKRVAVVEPYSNTWTLYFYDITGQRIMTLPSTLSSSYSVYFGSKLLVSDGVTVITDRLGSVRANSNNETFSYFPYGEERTPTADYRVKFGTYFRDGNWDYADQRYYFPGSGRFNTPDPSGAKTANPVDPTSWNMYAYTGGDPTNRNDPTGTINEVDSLMAPPDLFGMGGGGGGWNCAPDWLTNASIAGPCGNPCGNSFLPNPNCAFQGPTPPPDPGPAPVQAPDCSVSLYERPVQVPGVSLLADHTYLLLKDASGQSTIEGGPDLVGAGYLMGTFSSPPGNGLPGTDPTRRDNKQVGSSYTGSMACADVLRIEVAESKYNASGKWAKYDPTAILGYNSNGFTFTLLNDVGLSDSFGSTLRWTPGWRQIVPGL